MDAQPYILHRTEKRASRAASMRSGVIKHSIPKVWF